jgi:kynureninase
MQAIPEFIPQEGADGWQLSNPSIFAAAPLIASLALFDEATMPALTAKSRVLTGYLEFLLRESMPDTCSIITPASTSERGCQLSIRVSDHPRQRFDALSSRGVVGDFRAPDVIRLAPVPLYNRFTDVHRAAATLAASPTL